MRIHPNFIVIHSHLGAKIEYKIDMNDDYLLKILRHTKKQSTRILERQHVVWLKAKERAFPDCDHRKLYHIFIFQKNLHFCHWNQPQACLYRLCHASMSWSHATLLYQVPESRSSVTVLRHALISSSNATLSLVYKKWKSSRQLHFPTVASRVWF